MCSGDFGLQIYEARVRVAESLDWWTCAQTTWVQSPTAEGFFLSHLCFNLRFYLWNDVFEYFRLNFIRNFNNSAFCPAHKLARFKKLLIFLSILKNHFFFLHIFSVLLSTNCLFCIQVIKRKTLRCSQRVFFQLLLEHDLLLDWSSNC